MTPIRIGPYTVIQRDRIQASPPEGMRQDWTEYQVKLGRRVLARFDFLDRAVFEANRRVAEIAELGKGKP